MKVVCIMPTGARAEAFNLIVEYMSRQSFADWRWLILDDCDPAMPVPDDPRVQVIRPDWRWKRGVNTQASCMIELIDAALDERPDFTLVIEDDEWYSPEYLAEMVQRFEHSEKTIIGQTHAVFYNVRLRQCRVLPNREHTALCRTGVSIVGLRTMRSVFANPIPEKTVHDRFLWMTIPQTHRLIFDAPKPLNVGIKGMPGRAGIGTGHDRIKRDMIFDPSMRMLRQWIGATDAARYADFYNHKRVQR